MQTRSHSELQTIQDSIASLLSTVLDIRVTMDTRHEHTSVAIAGLQFQLSKPSISSPSSLTPAPQSPLAPDSPPKPSKLHLQLFDSTNPLDWVFQADQFFEFYSIPLDQRLKRVSCYMSGDALG
ncbi:hypothetical protein Sango_2316500 [Sesamum angolense]|uniref:Uncharacterized protein n=1 Tax=Sesamum angolense TaxID=2727404 RepID=A0AAE2BLJ9_9LAMI|nr:hypothetical protein Sango_2316500 [Sesamum angolense]